MIVRNLIRRRTRTLLTLLGIAMGVSAVVAMGIIAEGLINNWGNLLSGSGADLLVIQKGAMDASFSSLDEVLGERIAAVPDVASVDGGVMAYVSTEGLPFLLILGYEPQSPPAAHFRIIEGEPVRSSRQIALGRRAMESLKKQIGDTVRIYSTPYRIVGVYETGQAMEESGGLVTLRDGQEIAQKTRQVSLFQVRLRPQALSRIDSVIERIERIVPDVSVSRAADYGLQMEWADMTRAFAWGIAFIAIIVGGLGMMNTMVMSVYERTREIGVLRAVGWGRGRVLRMILGESLALSTIGGAAGIGLGIAMAKATATIPGIGGWLEGEISPQILVQGIVTAWVLGLVGGIYPAWRGANLQPIEALRYEGGSGGGDLGRGRLAWAMRLLPNAVRNLARRKTRTLLTCFGIGFGVASLVALGAWADGFIQQLNQLAGSSAAGAITVMQADVPDMSLSTVDERVGRAIAAMPEVESVSGMLLGFVSTKEMPLFIVMGLDPGAQAMRHYRLVEGRGIRHPSDIIIGRTAANNYKLRVGDSIQLYQNRYRIVGIYETGTAWEEGGGVVALSEAQAMLNKPRQVGFLFVDVRDPRDAPRVQAIINRRFPDVKASLSSEFAQNTQDIQNFRAMTSAIIALTVFIGGIIITNTMIMAVMERTREIGTLRALGWRQRRVLGTIVSESAVLGLISAFVGIGLGVGLLELLKLIPAASTFIAGVYGPHLMVQAIILALILGVIGGAYPAWRATRLSPVEALRYE